MAPDASDRNIVISHNQVNRGINKFAPDGSSFSDYMFDKYRNGGFQFPDGVKLKDNAWLNGQNMQQQVSHYKQNRETFWNTYSDWAILHPVVLSGWVDEFVQDSTAEIFTLFPIKISKEARFYKTEIRFENQLDGPGVRKAPGRMIHYQVETRSGNAIYTGQNFEIDYNRFRLPGGMEEFDMKLNAVVSDIWGTVILNAMKEFEAVPSIYNQPETSYPHDEIPTTIDKLFEYERTQFGALNKDPQAINNVISRVSEIMEQNHMGKAGRIIMTKDCYYHIKSRDETNIFYDQSGSQALVNRSDIDNTQLIHGIKPLFVQLMEPELHADIHDNVLRHVVSNGGMAVFPARYLEISPKDYRSLHRKIQLSSWSSDRLEEYCLMNHLRHCFEFIPQDSVACEDGQQGKINYRLLLSLATAATGAGAEQTMNPFARTRTQQVNNEQKLHQFLVYHKNSIFTKMLESTKEKEDKEKQIPDFYAPVLKIGEIHECHLKERHLKYTIDTLEHQLNNALTEDEQRIVNQADFVFNYTSWQDMEREINNDYNRDLVDALDKLFRRLSEICKDNVLGVAFLGAKHIHNVVSYLNAMQHIFTLAKNFNARLNNDKSKFSANKSEGLMVLNTLYLAQILSKLTNDPNAAIRAFTGSQEEIDPFLGMTEEAKKQLLTKIVIDELALKADDENNNFTDQMYQIFGNPNCFALATKIGAISNETFVRRVASLAVLLQTVSLEGMESWHENNVAIPFGGRIFRPFETQFMESAIITAEGPIGNTYFSGLDNIIGFDQHLQHFTAQFFTYFKVWIDNRAKFCVAPFIRGLTFLGGKGNRYINDHPNMGSLLEWGTDAWNDEIGSAFADMYKSVGEILGDYSIIPVLQSLNDTVRNDFKVRHYDVRGYIDENDYVSRLHECESFTTMRYEPMYDNQFLINHIFPQFTNQNIQRLSRQSANFNEVASRRRVNYAVHQTTQLYINEKTKDWDEVESSHYWGREGNGIIGIQTSTAPVTASY